MTKISNIKKLVTNEGFYRALFNPQEETCFGLNIYANHMTDVGYGHECAIIGNEQFFSINPMRTSRADRNVTSFRNILVEFDGLSQIEQLELLKTVPYTTLVWSGGKSYHAIISLAAPPTTLEEYRRWVKMVQAKLPQMDKSTGNPSRFSRCPGAVRDNGNIQTLVSVRSRISPKEFWDWIGDTPVPKAATHEHIHDPERRKIMTGLTKNFLMFGADSNRNSTLFAAACDMLRGGYTEDEIIDKASELLDLELREITNCVQSAMKRVRKDE